MHWKHTWKMLCWYRSRSCYPKYFYFVINSDVNSIPCTQGENLLERKCYKVDIHCFHALFVKVIWVNSFSCIVIQGMLKVISRVKSSNFHANLHIFESQTLSGAQMDLCRPIKEAVDVGTIFHALLNDRARNSESESESQICFFDGGLEGVL